MTCENQISSQDLVNAKSDTITIAEVATSREGGAPTGAPITQSTNRFGETTDTLQGRLDKLGVIYDDPIRDWSASLLVSDLRAHRYPAVTGDVYIPTTPLPLTTGATFDPSKWALATGVTASDVNKILINDLTQDYSCTVAEYKGLGFEFPIGKIINLLDRNASFAVIAGVTTGNNQDIIASNQVSQSVALNNTAKVSISQLGAGSADDAALINRAIAIASHVSVDVDVATSELSLLSDDKKITFEVDTTTTYTPSDNNSFMLDFAGRDDITFQGRGKILNTAARQSGGSPVVDTFSGTGIIRAYQSTNITTKHAQFIEGSHGVFYEEVTDSAILNCRFIDQQSWSLITADGESLHIIGNYGKGNATDCFKFRGQSTSMTVSNNIAEYNFSDGFDLFDGFFSSSFTGNIARFNTNFGFECKGTPSDDYNFRDSTVGSNVAHDNGLQGFSIVSIRGCSFNGNISTANLIGFVYDGCQENSFTGEVAEKNEEEGFKLGNTSDVSRNGWTSCFAINNSKSGAGLFSNWLLTSFASGNDFIGCRGHSGTGIDSESAKYGMEFESGSAGNRVTGGNYEPNSTDSFGGDVDSQIITNAGVMGGTLTKNMTLGDFTLETPAAATGTMIVKGNDGVEYKLSCSPVV